MEKIIKNAAEYSSVHIPKNVVNSFTKWQPLPEAPHEP
jgi:hypothetical protein